MDDKPRFAPIARRPLRDEIRERILERVHNSQPGDELPGEKDLAAQLGVGRASIREVMRALAELGIIEVRTGARARVASPLNVNVVNAMTLALALPEDPFEQLLEARQLLEVGCAALAARRISDAHLQEIGEQLARFAAGRAGGDVDEMVAADLAFHSAIIKATGNPVFVQMIAPVNKLLQKARERSIGDREAWASIAKDHKAIFDALKLRNSEAARRAMSKHLLVLTDDPNTL